MFQNAQQEQDFFYRLNFKTGKSEVMRGIEWTVKYKLLPMLEALPEDLRSWEMFYATKPNFVLQSSGAIFAGDDPLVEGIMLHLNDGSSRFWSAGDDKIYSSRSQWQKEHGRPGYQTVKEFVQFAASSYRKINETEHFIQLAVTMALKTVEQMGLVTGDPKIAFKYFYQSCKSRQVNVKHSLDEITKELVNEYKRARVTGSI